MEKTEEGKDTDMREEEVVMCFLECGERVLILKRNEKVGVYPGKWEGVAGHIDSGETPDQAALREVEEETGLVGGELVKRGAPQRFLSPRQGVVWIVYPYLFRIGTNQITTNWEHVDHKWIYPHETKKYETIPMLRKCLRVVKN